jgi:hypothetical protein
MEHAMFAVPSCLPSCCKITQFYGADKQGDSRARHLGLF